MIDYAALKKGGFMRQRPVEYFSLRLGITGGRVTAEQLAVIMEVSKKYGRGYIHLTSRQGIEIPYIEYEDIDTVKEELSKGGVFPGASGPRVRTITACQGNAVCGNACIDTQGIAKILHERYYGRDLPGCPNNCLKAEENDLGIKGGIRTEWTGEGCVHCGKCVKSCRRGAISDSEGQIMIDRDKCVHCGKCARVCPAGAFRTQEGYVVYFGGLFGNTISIGETLLPFITDKEALLRVCDAAVNFFKDNAKPGERFKFTIDRVGIEALREKLNEALIKVSPA